MADLIEFEIPPHVSISQCRSCGALIVWKVTTSGKRMPLSWATRRVDEETGKQYAQSHFADCPHADQHRTKE